MVPTPIYRFLLSQAAEVMSTDLQADSFLRIASISVAGYDYLATLPVELRVYRSMTRLQFGWSTSVVLFILLRYVSIVLLAISNIGWFYHGFSPEACSKYYLVAPVFKVIQIIISQIIVGYQTWNISQRSREMGIFLLALGFAIAALETFSNFDSRIPVQKSGNCAPGNDQARVPQWVFYLLSTVFNVATIVLSSFFLIKSASGIGRMSSTLKMLFYDGLGYVFVLTAVNVMNLVLYRNSVEHDTQASGASFGYMVVWIMSQSFLIHVHEAAEVRAQREFIFSPRGRVARSGNVVRDENGSVNLDVQVQIERAVMVDYHPKTHWKAGVFWDRRPTGIDITNGGSADPAQWELSRVVKSGGDS